MQRSTDARLVICVSLEPCRSVLHRQLCNDCRRRWFCRARLHCLPTATASASARSIQQTKYLLVAFRYRLRAAKRCDRDSWPLEKNTESTVHQGFVATVDFPTLSTIHPAVRSSANKSQPRPG